MWVSWGLAALFDLTEALMSSFQLYLRSELGQEKWSGNRVWVYRGGNFPIMRQSHP
jgi:hypothetical protein